MSTDLGTQFGNEFGDDYATVVSDWGDKLEGVDTVTPDMHKDWGADLTGALGDSLIIALVANAVKDWGKAGPVPIGETLKLFASVAIKAILAKQMFDLLNRLHTRVNDHDKACVVAAGCPERLTETLKRAGQTVAQIFDMVKDGFNNIMERFYMRKGNLTGNRRWVTVTSGPKDTSRHAALDGEVRKQGDTFSFEKTKIFGPRPPGGHPDHWSNCSCYLEYETKNGKWI